MHEKNKDNIFIYISFIAIITVIIILMMMTLFNADNYGKFNHYNSFTNYQIIDDDVLLREIYKQQIIVTNKTK